jgi:hypothetical protein
MRPKLKEEEKKISLSITIDREIIKGISNISNKSRLIEDLLREYLKKKEEK